MKTYHLSSIRAASTTTIEPSDLTDAWDKIRLSPLEMLGLRLAATRHRLSVAAALTRARETKRMNSISLSRKIFSLTFREAAST